LGKGTEENISTYDGGGNNSPKKIT